MKGHDIQDRARTLEIFLDAVAAHASDDASWFLDERFDALTGEHGDLVTQARKLYQRAAGAGEVWQPLADALATFGAASGSDTDEAEERRWRSRLPGG